jgi:hypothetical protein
VACELPGITTINAFVDTACLAAFFKIPGAACLIPHSGVQFAGIFWIDIDISSPGIFVNVKRLLPGFTAICVLYTPRSLLGEYKWPSAATQAVLLSVGCNCILPI